MKYSESLTIVPVVEAQTEAVVSDFGVVIASIVD
jgi:hypothetical protein